MSTRCFNEAITDVTARPATRQLAEELKLSMPTTEITTIAFIGSGNIGGTAARLAARAGYAVVVSNSRGPASLTDLVAELGDAARAASPQEAAEAGDLVVISVPLKAQEHLPVEELAGKVVLDTTNYYPQRDGHVTELDDASVTTGEFLQARLQGASVVRAFNTIPYRALEALARPSGAPDRSALPIAGDDSAAKTAASGFLDRIGYDAVDAGPLAEGWRFERDTPAYGSPYIAPGGADDFRAADGEEIRELLDRASRAS